MGNTRSSELARIDWLAKEPLAPHIDAYMLYLANRDYATNTFSSYITSIAHFAQWLHGRRLQLGCIDESVVAEFLDDHLPRCRCTGSVQRDRRTLSAALGHLLAVLRARGVVVPPTASTTPADEELLCYDAYMDHVRGLAPKTREIALRIVGRLLTSRFGDDAIGIAAIKPDHVRDFFAQQSKLYSKPANAGSVIAALRGYFRYRASLGDAVHGLIGALSYPANWRLASLPKTLTTEEIEQLVGSLGKPGRSLRRADAIVRCALDLGLRSGEVARLSLDDIDWRASTIVLRHTTGRREDVLPCGQPVGPDLVRKAIRQAFARAGLPYTRSHLLRHTMANRLLAGGASLKEVADVLRHRSLNTTMIYAKLDSRKLTEVALPWPGSAA